ncbi:MAG: hypothetical protein ACRDUA_20375, partial [Micromonosporaceae bacterium]
VLEDTGTGTPATPVSALSLATVSVTAGQVTVLDSHITQTQLAAKMVGSPTFTSGGSTSRSPAPRIPELHWRTDLNALELWDGSGTWKEMARTQTWATYVPTWTAVTTNPTLGNGVLQGRWMRSGSTVRVQVYLRMGSTTTYGSGFWRFALPSAVTHRTIPGTAMAHAVGTAMFRDNSATNHQDGGCLIDTTGSLALIKDDTVRNTFPWTWAVGDELLAQIEYEVN